MAAGAGFYASLQGLYMRGWVLGGRGGSGSLKILLWNGGLLPDGVMNETSRVATLSASRRRAIALLVGFIVFRLPLMGKYVNRI